MNIPNTGIREIPPTHPGVMLREEYMPDYGLTVGTLARALGVSRQTINELLRERRALSPSMALRLSRLFGNSPEFWLNAQRAVDLWQAGKELNRELEQIRMLHAAYSGHGAPCPYYADDTNAQRPAAGIRKRGVSLLMSLMVT